MGVYKYVNLILEDGSKLPVGFMFNPTDDEIVDYYLTRKVYYQLLPLHYILEFDVSQIDAMDVTQRFVILQFSMVQFETRKILKCP